MSLSKDMMVKNLSLRSIKDELHDKSPSDKSPVDNTSGRQKPLARESEDDKSPSDKSRGDNSSRRQKPLARKVPDDKSPRRQKLQA